MQWTPEAEGAVRRVPFFVRRKVRARIEADTAAAGRAAVTLADVEASRRRFLARMSEEVQGYRVETCFGAGGCPNRIADTADLAERIEGILQAADLLGFLRSRVDGPLKFHHEFRVAVAECPNCCSQVQIKDVGVIAACRPQITAAGCSGCGACVDVCPDKAVATTEAGPRIDVDLCQRCGRCIGACPTGTLATGETGYRVQLGGKLGRHPRLARELPGLYCADAVVSLVRACIDLYKEKSGNGRRFAEVLTDADFEALAKRFASKG